MSGRNTWGRLDGGGGTENFEQWKPVNLCPDSDKPKYLTPVGPVEGIKPLVDHKTWERIAQRYGKDYYARGAPERGFWAWVNNHPDIPVFITEDLKKLVLY